jgi:hypothetical protein
MQQQQLLQHAPQQLLLLLLQVSLGSPEVAARVIGVLLLSKTTPAVLPAWHLHMQVSCVLKPREKRTKSKGHQGDNNNSSKCECSTSVRLNVIASYS